MSRSVFSRPRFLGRRGSTSLEMAWAASGFFTLLLGGAEIGRYFFVVESVNHLVGELSRAVVVNPNANWSTEKTSYIAKAPILKAAKFSASNGGRLDVTIVPAVAPALTTVTVTARYPYSFGLSFLPDAVSSINSTTTLRFAAPPP